MAFTTLWLNSNKSNESFIYLLISIINAALYPFAHYAIKTIALKFAPEEFWNKDIFTSPTGGSLSAILYVFCFALAIPLSIVYFLNILFIYYCTYQSKYQAKTKNT